MSPTLLLYVSVLIRNLMALIDLKGLMHRYGLMTFYVLKPLKW